MSRQTSRRTLLAGLSAGAVASIAGCSVFDKSGSGTTPETFAYPDGFSKKGIEDFKKALGTESAHYKAPSFTLDSEYTSKTTGSSSGSSGSGSTSTKITARSEVSGKNQTQFYHSENQSTVQEQYQTATQVFLRLYSKKKGPSSAQYQVQKANFNKETAYLITFFKNQFKDVDLEVDKVLSKDRVRYVASLDSLPDNHQLVQKYSNLESLTMELTVDTQGYVRRAALDLTRTTSGGQTVNESYWFTFSKHGETTVTKPDWLDKARKSTSGSGSGSTDGSTSGDSTTDGSSSGSDSTSNRSSPDLHPHSY